MTYRDATDFLFQQLPMFERNGAADYKPGLSTILRLVEWQDMPHRRFRTVHVAGTNGKGSVSHSIAAILQQMGFRVGLFTSPHLVDFRERIRVNGQPISETDVTGFVERYQDSDLGRDAGFNPTFFEITTALAFSYFAESKVDWAVIETGLGGRLDSTNVIVPQLSVITNISLDHTQLLGSTLAQIAAEKAGIIKPGVPVVVGETHAETRPVFEAAAKAVGAPLFFADQLAGSFRQWDSQLQGDFQKQNTQTVICAMNVLLNGFICRGLSHVTELTGLRGRWETLQERPLVICDTGHNPGAWRYLGRQIAEVPCRQRRVVFGMVGDKDVAAVVSMLPKDAIYYLTQPSSYRAMPVEQLATIALDAGLQLRRDDAGQPRHKDAGQPRHEDAGQPLLYDDACAAYSAALADASPDDFIFIGGSSYLVADLLTALNAETTIQRKTQ